ncbi:MAG TPA: amidohydrolase, partial [Acidobacteriota bacterium]|nr:amidohydrolase [Acidobacteriota bacterium]
FNIMDAASQQEFVRRTQEIALRLAPGEWIVGGFWGAYDQWSRGRASAEAREPFTPDLFLVKELTRHRPLFIQKFDASEFAVNEAALARVGLDPEKPAPEGVEFIFDGRGVFTGRIRGSGVLRLFTPHIPEQSYSRRLRQSRRALEEIRRRGVTTISDMSDDLQLQIFEDLHAAGELTVRVHFRYPIEQWESLADRGVRIGSGTPWIRLGALKGHVDGIMGNSTARFLQPYEHLPETRGNWRRLLVDEEGDFAGERFLEFMKLADRAGLQLSIHAIGDKANRLLLDYLEAMIQENGQKDRRVRLVHAQVLAPEDFTRLGGLNVIAEVQPYHLSDDMRWMEERIGRKRCRGAYGFKTILDSGALLTFGSDWPGTSAAEYPIDPMLGIYAAVTRRTIEGEPQGGWFPEERIGIEDALRAYTYHSAYANFEEKLTGSIEVGKLADLAVLSRNVLEIEADEIPDVSVHYTIVEGRIVFQASD